KDSPMRRNTSSSRTLTPAFDHESRRAYNPRDPTMRPSVASIALAAAALAVCTVAVYWPIRNAGFVDYDDPQYVTDNAYVRRGLTLDGVVWALTTDETGTWHPLTWL